MVDNFYLRPDSALKERRSREYRDLFIVPFFPHDTRVRILELGCGYGLFMQACRASGYENVSGVDSNSEAIEYAKKELGIERIICADAFRYLEDQPDESFDVIIAANFVEHVKKERVPQLFSYVGRKLAPGGRFIIEVPNADSIHGMHTYFSDMTHEWAYTKPLVTHLMQQAGLRGIQVLPNRIRSNKLIRLAQKILTKIMSGDDKLQYAGSIIAVGYKE